MSRQSEPFVISPYLVRLAMEKAERRKKVEQEGYDENVEKGNLIVLYGILAFVGSIVVWLMTRRSI